MSQTARAAKRVLGAFTLAMITAGSVDSIRNLPLVARFGSSLVFFFILGALLFLLPGALISAELASTSKKHGGVFVWVSEAFGAQAGFLAVWFQWIENVIWYPAILSFIAGTVGYLISPTLAQNPLFLSTIIIVAFWGTTLINLRGIHSSARFSNFCVTIGLLLPMALVIAFGVLWLMSGKPIQIHLTAQAFLPHLSDMHQWVALTGVMLSFCGIEIATVHGFDVKNPQKAYPRAMLIATLIIVFTLMFGALAIAMVVPGQQIQMVSGIMQMMSVFFITYHIHWLLPVFAGLLVIGIMGSVNNWVIAPTRGLLLAGKQGFLPKRLCAQNRHGAPSALLISQALIVTAVAMVFELMPSVNASYWLLTVLAAQLYMVMYVIMFIAAIRLRYVKGERRDGFRIPGGNVGIWIVGGIGVIGSLLTFVLGFIPPSGIKFGGLMRYEELVFAGLIVMSSLPFLLSYLARRD